MIYLVRFTEETRTYPDGRTAKPGQLRLVEAISFAEAEFKLMEKIEEFNSPYSRAVHAIDIEIHEMIR